MTTTTTTTTTRVRSRLAASLAALAFLGLATACGAQSTVTDQPAPRVQPTGSTPPTGFPPPVRNGSGPADTAESGGIHLRRSAEETLDRVAQHEARYHGDARPGRP